MSQGEEGMPPQDLPERPPYFSRAASSGAGQFGTTGQQEFFFECRGLGLRFAELPVGQ